MQLRRLHKNALYPRIHAAARHRENTDVAEKLGIVLYTDERYAVPTFITALSAVKNNAALELHFYVFCVDSRNWKSQSSALLESLGSYGNVGGVHIIDSAQIDQRCAGVGLDSGYKGSYGAFAKLFMCDFIQADYNIVWLDSDVLVAGGLEELCGYRFTEEKCFAACIDMNNSRGWRQKLKTDAPIVVASIFVANPVAWQAGRNSARIEQWFARFTREEISMLMPSIVVDQGVLTCVFGSQWYILPAKYQVLPGYPLVGYNNFRLLFSLRKDDFYTKKDMEDAVRQPVIIHFMHFIVTKPWLHDARNSFEPLWLSYYHSVPEAAGLFELREHPPLEGFEKLKRLLFAVSPFLFCLLGRFDISHNVKCCIKNFKTIKNW
ncbi:MAG TPA: hypothetical protein DDW78_03220 [Treponema sp.]|nr:hypothetical protein [Treponema sp.]